MSSPAKRRRKNNFAASDAPVRSLDYFFNKHKETPTAAEPGPKDATDTQTLAEPLDDTALTDEQLARKLQEEWDREAGVVQDQTLTPPPNGHHGGLKDALSKEASLPLSLEDAPKALGPEPGHEVETKQPNIGGNFLKLQSTATAEDTITTNIPFDESPLQFDPAKYLSELKAHWGADGGHATYALLTRCFVLVNSTQSRIKIVDTLVNVLRTIIEGDPESLLPAVWLATNSISPPYIDLELGLGGSAISKALKTSYGLDNGGLKSLYNKHGDAGDVAFEAKKRQSFTLRKPKPLTIKGVYDSLRKIANSKGQGSQEAKQRIVERLLQDARGAEESRYVVRTLVQHLRIGAVKTTMLIALSRAFLLSRPPGADFSVREASSLAKLRKEELAEIYSRNEEMVKASFARRPNYNDLIPTLLEIGVCDGLLLRCGLALHIPLRPMLGSITRDTGEVLIKLQGREFSCEFKYDGQRAQVHCDERGQVTIFSRHLEVMTEKYPDLVALVPKIRGEGVSSFILEGEVVAIDRESGELRPFQVLANRARKDVVIQSVKIDVCLFAFDLMFLNGVELLDKPFRERRSLLRSLFTEIPHHFTWVKSMDATSADQEAVSDFFKQATEIKCEGIMVKVLDNLPNPTLFDEAGEERHSPMSPPTPSKKTKKTKPKTKSISDAAAATNDTSDAATDAPKTGGRRKALLATYEPDKRLDSWLKVKKDYNTSADTIDLIPIGGWHGQGRKHKWWSPVLLAVRNPETGVLEAVTKCISGFTDKFYEAMRARYDPDADAGSSDGDDDENDDDGHVKQKKTPNSENTPVNNTRPTKPAFVSYAGHPSVWFEPREVWECAFADITLSPTYPAALGLVNDERGLSLRFPRFLRVRDDKGIEDASTSDFLAALYRKQGARPAAPPTIRGDEVGDGDGEDAGEDEGEGEQLQQEDEEEEEEGLETTAP
ncbi:hypothetical protein IWX90DRAFT_101626 [Phyllosticta citrichinensis]|uniref:DNA ligase n=1 Tax=Phyllosticta citrichinensis TaxID=1130410 RepID=A0ABR1Y2H1_9PEZI